MNYSAEACVSRPIAHAGTGTEFEEIKNSRIFDQRKTGNRATEVGGFTPGIGTGGEDSVDGDPQQNIRHHPQAHRDDSVDQDRGIWSHLRGSNQDTEDSRRSADELGPGTVDQDMGAPENQIRKSAGDAAEQIEGKVFPRTQVVFDHGAEEEKPDHVEKKVLAADVKELESNESPDLQMIDRSKGGEMAQTS